MKVKFSSLAALTVCLLFLASGAFAGSIPVANGNFDALPAGGWQACDGTGCYNYSVGIPGWSTTGYTGQWQPASGYLQPYSGDSYIGWTSPGGTIAQDGLTTAVAGELYTLTVEIGTRRDYGPPAGVAQITLNGAPVATATGTYGSGNTWSLFTAHFTPTGGQNGGTIGILLSASGGGPQGDFDAVTLSVPEHSTLATLLGFGIFNLAAVFGFRRKLT
jgi:hypothetical protein